MEVVELYAGPHISDDPVADGPVVKHRLARCRALHKDAGAVRVRDFEVFNQNILVAVQDAEQTLLRRDAPRQLVVEIGDPEI